MKSLTLYSTTGCHLCEQAMELIGPIVADQYVINTIDIGNSDELIDRYGVRIPVIAREDGLEIGWPFDKGSFLHFLNS